MTRTELEVITEGGESEQVEFKASTGQRTQAAKAVCAMLDGQGGFVFFGISDTGEVQGQDVTANTLADIVRELQKIEPQVLIQPEVITLDSGRSVVALSVPGTMGGPYTFDGRPFVRQGPTTIQMPQDLYRRKLLEQMHPSQRWETQTAHRVKIEQLDAAEITRTVDEAIRRGRMEEPGTRDPAELLRGLGLMIDGQLLNAAVALFAQDDVLLPYYPQCLLRMARFQGVTQDIFGDNQQAHGNAFALLRRAQRFLRAHLPIAGRIVPGLFEREDDPLYPPEALREALANALCHRDYGNVGGSIGLAIYDDRLEISSTGTLPFGMKTEDLLRPHASRPWNKLIANVFYRRGLIEQWGRGTLKIAELTQRAGLVPPEFEERSGELVVRFRPVAYELNNIQERMLERLGQGPASLSELMETVPDETARRTLQNHLQALRDLRLVDVEGKGRGAKWFLIGSPANRTLVD